MLRPGPVQGVESIASASLLGCALTREPRSRQVHICHICYVRCRLFGLKSAVRNRAVSGTPCRTPPGCGAGLNALKTQRIKKRLRPNYRNGRDESLGPFVSDSNEQQPKNVEDVMGTEGDPLGEDARQQRFAICSNRQHGDRGLFKVSIAVEHAGEARVQLPFTR